MFDPIPVDPLVAYLFIVLAFVGGFVTCAVLTFGGHPAAPEEQEEDHAGA